MQFLGQLTDLEIVDDNGIVFVYELADWRYNSCCTGTECTLQCAVMAHFHQVVDGQVGLNLLALAPVCADVDQGITGYARSTVPSSGAV